MRRRCVLLSGGVGGAKLALGLARAMNSSDLTVVANVADDFTHLGLRICPDLDTLMYTLAGCVNEESGWGRNDESWHFLESVGELGGPQWFRLGDRDLATHIVRSAQLAAGRRLTEITAELCARLGVSSRLLPATDQPVATRLHTDAGILAFQEYFVRLRAGPAVTGIDYAGAESAKPPVELEATLMAEGLEAIVIAPSNPYLSIDPILSVPGLRRALRSAGVPVVAVSPIVAGRALKGPTAKLMRELGLEATAASVARHYRTLVDGFILDTRDRTLAGEIADLGLQVSVCNTMMTALSDKIRLAENCLAFADSIRETGRRC